MTARSGSRTRPFSTTALVAITALVALVGQFAPAAALAPPGVTAPVNSPPDPVVSEAARRLSLGRDLVAVLGDRLTAQHGEEDRDRAELDAKIDNLDLRRRARQALLERIAVDTSDLTGTKRDHQGHLTNMVDLLQGSLFAVASGTQLLMIDPQKASDQQYHEELYEAAAAYLQRVLHDEEARIKSLESSIAEKRVSLVASQTAITSASSTLPATRR